MNTVAFDLKPLTREGVPAAIEKANRYRLLNEPGEAESICLDVLGVDPDNQQALVVLLLALTDRFGRGFAVGATQTQEVLARLRDPYERAYYAGLVYERKAKAALAQGSLGAGFKAHDLVREAMAHFEAAEKIRPAGNDDALLRWNACARIIMRNSLEPRGVDQYEPALE
ncbi:MAG: hypothetical protein EXS36_15125 [Pedosphaera sp.]|nr:hypothetical protein [Pedosphaera sp.]